MNKRFLPLYKVFILFLVIINFKANAQAPSVIPGAKALEVDLEKHTISGEVPFDKPFYLTGKIPDKLNIATLEFEVGKRIKTGTLFSLMSNISVGKKPFFLIFNRTAFNNEFLLPDRNYIFKIRACDKDGNELPEYGIEYGITTNTKTGDRTKLDFGIGYAPKPKALIGVTSVNFYFTAINDDTDLQEISNNQRNLFLRTGVYAGISPITLSSSTDQPIKNRMGLGNFIFGISVRSPFYGNHTPWTFRNKVGQELLQPMRLIVGEMLFKQADPNPLVIQDRNKAAFYFGISYDLNIASILGPIGKIISK